MYSVELSMKEVLQAQGLFLLTLSGVSLYHRQYIPLLHIIIMLIFKELLKLTLANLKFMGPDFTLVISSKG